MRSHDFDRALDDCLDRLQSGETVSECLRHYPQHVIRLEPLLKVASHARAVDKWSPSDSASDHARARLRIGIANRSGRTSAARRPSLVQRLVFHPLPMAAIATVAVIALTVLLIGPLAPAGTTPPPTAPTIPDGTTPIPPDTSSEPPVTTPPQPTKPPDATPATEPVIAVPDADGNYIFYLSDAPNDIADFSSLIVTIESIELKPHGSGPWVSIEPTERRSDLVQLQGDLAHELWRGQVPEGDYATVFVSISHIEGVLASSGLNADVVLPSGALHVTSSFSISSGRTTEFVFDITVHRTGGAGQQARYILVPQAGESGVGRAVRPVTPRLEGAGNSNAQTSPPGQVEPNGPNSPEGDMPRPGSGPGPGQGPTRSGPEDREPA